MTQSFENVLNQLLEICNQSIEHVNQLNKTKSDIIKSINIMAQTTRFDENPDIKKYKKQLLANDQTAKIILQLFNSLSAIDKELENQMTSVELVSILGIKKSIEVYTNTKPIGLSPRYIDWIPGIPTYKYYVTTDGKIHQIIKGEDCTICPRNIDGVLIINLTPKKHFSVAKLIWEAYHPEYRNMNYDLYCNDNDPLHVSLSNLTVKLGKPTNII